VGYFTVDVFNHESKGKHMENRLDVINRELQASDSSKEMLSEGKAMMQTKTEYTTAVTVQKERKLPVVIKNLLQEAKMAGGAFYYRWPVKGGKMVQGPSIDLAMSMARQYGNCAVEVDVKETHSHYLFKGVFIDLETGFTVPRIFRQRKDQNIGKGMDKGRAEDIVFQIGQSKAQRNAIIKAMPGWLVEQLIEVAIQAELDNIKPESLEMTRAKVITYFEGYGIDSEALEKKIGKPSDKWMQDDILTIKDMARSIKDGTISVRELFQDEEKEKQEDAMKEKLHAAVSAKEDEKATEEETGPWHPDKYKNLKAAGFIKYVMDNLEELKEQGADTIAAVGEKWSRVYPDTRFPLDPEPKDMEPEEKPDREKRSPGIYGTDLADGFFNKCAPEDLKKTAQDIWDHPTQYRDGIGNDGSEQAYHRFLKHLIVVKEDGSECPISEFIEPEKSNPERVQYR
jgi:hypothetical protein